MDTQVLSNSFPNYCAHMKARIDKTIKEADKVARIIAAYSHFHVLQEDPCSFVPVRDAIHQAIYEAHSLSLYEDKTVVYLDLDGVLIQLDDNTGALDPKAVKHFNLLLDALGNAVVVLSSQQRIGSSIFDLRMRFRNQLFGQILIGKTPDSFSEEIEDQLIQDNCPGIVELEGFQEVRANLKAKNYEAQGEHWNIFAMLYRELKILYHAKKHGCNYFAIDDLPLSNLLELKKLIYVDGNELLTRDNVTDALSKWQKQGHES